MIILNTVSDMKTTYNLLIGDKKIAEITSLDDITITTKETKGFASMAANLSQDQIKEIIEKI
jgi:hypothetical protein